MAIAAQPVKSLQTQPRLRGLWQQRLNVFWRSWEVKVCSVYFLALLIVSLLPLSVLSPNETGMNLMSRLLSPGTDGYALGTDALGRDIWGRVLVGTKLTLLIAFSSAFLSTLIGAAAGIVAGFMGNAVDSVISRVVDVLLAFPSTLLILAIAAALGQSVGTLILVLAFTGCAGVARIVRSATLSLSEADFVEAAVALGATRLEIMWRHLLPNVISPILVIFTLNLATFILAESAISFLGLGVQPPDVTWGGMIGEGRAEMLEAWWVAFFPGLAIVLTVLAFNVVGDAMRDAFDPRGSNRFDKEV